MTATMTNPETKDEQLPVEYLAHFTSNTTRDLHALATPSELTILGGLIGLRDKPTKAQQICYYFARKFSKAQQSVCFVSESAASEIAGVLEAVNADMSDMRHVGVKTTSTENQILSSVGQSDLVLIWLPRATNSDQASNFTKAARRLADNGAAVLMVIPFKENQPVGKPWPVISQAVGGDCFEGMGDRVWLVIDHTETQTAHHLRQRDCLAPVRDRVATVGYMFSMEAGFPTFEMSYRSNAAEKSLSRPPLCPKLYGE